jgi:Na+/H+ antiporter NhaA
MSGAARAVRRGIDQTVPRRRELLQQLAQPLRSFLSREQGSARLLLAGAVIALLWANSPASSSYESVWTTDLSVLIGGDGITLDLRDWVNDGLMFLFFWVIGLEVRRELTLGELTERGTLTVPAIAAAGGMILPAAIYLAINPSGDAASAWGMVIATDTAFLLGALAILGPSASTPLRVFLLTLSIFDDIVAVTVIGLFYSSGLNLVALGIAVGCLVAFFVLGRLGVRGPPLVVLSGVLWVAAVKSGIHPTLAGMALGLIIPVYEPRREVVEQAAAQASAFRQSPVPSLARSAARSVARAVSPNERVQETLHPWTSYVIVPLFALANAGVDLRHGALADALSSPVTWGVIAALAGGKLIGIGASALGAVRLGLGRLPRGVGRVQVLGGAALSGIGFTVSLLIIELGLDTPALREEAKVGVLGAAIIATIGGWLIFRLSAMLGEPTGLPTVLDPPVDPERDHIRGRVDAPLTLLEFEDFECPFCARATGLINDLRQRFGDELRYVMRHLPLTDVHMHTEIAAEAAEAAGAQGKFWEFHDLLFEHQDQLEFEDLLGYAAELELDVERFARELEEGVHSARVREDVASAEASGANGTPTFFVNGRRHVGPYDAETLARELEESRER